jgi:hypothetical protein
MTRDGFWQISFYTFRVISIASPQPDLVAVNSGILFQPLLDVTHAPF